MMTNMNFERSARTTAVVDVLRQINGEMSYQTMSQKAAMTVAELKAVLSSARRIVRSQHKILFGVIRGIGLRRLDDHDKVRSSEAVKLKAARALGRGIKDIDTIDDYGQLSPAEQIQVSTNRTVMHLTRGQLIVSPPKPEPQRPELPLVNTTNLIKLAK